MNISINEKKTEAIKRMKMMRIIPGAIKQFKDKNQIMVSEPPFGGLYWIEDELQITIKEFEEKNNALVYLVVRAFTNLGKMDSLLFVGDYKKDWEMENEDIKDGIVFSYTINYDMPDCSEMGSIGFRSIGGGVLRIY